MAGKQAEVSRAKFSYQPQGDLMDSDDWPSLDQAAAQRAERARHSAEEALRAQDVAAVEQRKWDAYANTLLVDFASRAKNASISQEPLMIEVAVKLTYLERRRKRYQFDEGSRFKLVTQPDGRSAWHVTEELWVFSEGAVAKRENLNNTPGPRTAWKATREGLPRIANKDGCSTCSPILPLADALLSFLDTGSMLVRRPCGCW